MTPKMNSSPGRRRFMLRVAGTAVSLALLFRFVPLQQLWGQLGTVSFQSWLPVLVGYICAHLIAATKWRLLINAAGAELNWPQAVRSYFTGLFSSLFLPSLVGGDVVRAGLAMTLSRCRAGILLGSVLDRLLDVMVTTIVAGAGALMIGAPLHESTRRVLWLAAFALGGVSTVVVVILWMLPRWRLPRAVRRRLGPIRRAQRVFVRRLPYVVMALPLVVTSQMLLIVMMAVLAEACGLHVGLAVWIFAFPLAKLLALTPATIAGIGVREAALAVLLAPFGVASAAALAVGFMWETIVVAGAVCAGVLAWALTFRPGVLPRSASGRDALNP